MPTSAGEEPVGCLCLSLAKPARGTWSQPSACRALQAPSLPQSRPCHLPGATAMRTGTRRGEECSRTQNSPQTQGEILQGRPTRSSRPSVGEKLRGAATGDPTAEENRHSSAAAGRADHEGCCGFAAALRQQERRYGERGWSSSHPPGCGRKQRLLGSAGGARGGSAGAGSCGGFPCLTGHIPRVNTLEPLWASPWVSCDFHLFGDRLEYQKRRKCSNERKISSGWNLTVSVSAQSSPWARAASRLGGNSPGDQVRSNNCTKRGPRPNRSFIPPRNPRSAPTRAAGRMAARGTGD